MTDRWTKADDLQRAVTRFGVRGVAEQIPADRSTVYRMLRGDIQRPTRAVQAGIERILQKLPKDKD